MIFINNIVGRFLLECCNYKRLTPTKANDTGKCHNAALCLDVQIFGLQLYLLFPEASLEDGTRDGDVRDGGHLEMKQQPRLEFIEEFCSSYNSSRSIASIVLRVQRSVQSSSSYNRRRCRRSPISNEQVHTRRYIEHQPTDACTNSKMWHRYQRHQQQQHQPIWLCSLRHAISIHRVQLLQYKPIGIMIMHHAHIHRFTQMYLNTYYYNICIYYTYMHNLC